MRLIYELEDWGYNTKKVIHLVTHCNHYICEGYIVKMKPGDDDWITIGRRCKKCGLSGELIDYINSHSPKFIDQKILRDLK